MGSRVSPTQTLLTSVLDISHIGQCSMFWGSWESSWARRFARHGADPRWSARTGSGASDREEGAARAPTRVPGVGGSSRLVGCGAHSHAPTALLHAATVERSRSCPRAAAWTPVAADLGQRVRRRSQVPAHFCSSIWPCPRRPPSPVPGRIPEERPVVTREEVLD